MIKNKRVLITGATGFIGANLARRFLKTGAKIYIFTRSTSNKWRINNILRDAREYRVDLLDYEKLQKVILKIKPEIIIHTAVYGGYSFQKDEIKTMQNNIIGTVNLVNACARAGFECFINSGSSSEYGLKTKPMKEEDSLVPVNAYGVSKASSTLYCQMKAKNDNLPIVTLRPFSPYGYYEEKTRLIPSVIISCVSGKDPRLSFPDGVRDFVFIEDVIRAYIKAVDKIRTIKGEIFNIGCGQQYSVKDVVDKIIELTGNKVCPKWGVFSRQFNEPAVWKADISKIKRCLNWQPRFNLCEGLNKTIKWFEKNVSLYKQCLSNKG